MRGLREHGIKGWADKSAKKQNVEVESPHIVDNSNEHKLVNIYTYLRVDLISEVGEIASENER